jgi:hypothetical protein
VNVKSLKINILFVLRWSEFLFSPDQQRRFAMDASNAGALDVLVENDCDRRISDFLNHICGVASVQRAW